MPDARRAAWGGGALLLAVYLATVAPTVTLWDAGEFLSAARSLGIPHPPGTPLFVFAANVWASLLAPVPFALAVNAASAVATAAAAACFAYLVARWTGSWQAGMAGAVAGGGMAAVWQSATETEVYALSFLLVALSAIVADRAGRDWSVRHRLLLVFLFGLAVPLHISALVAGPAMVYLAATDAGGVLSLRATLIPGGAWLVAMGLGTVAAPPIALGIAIVAVGAATLPEGGESWVRRATVPLLLTALGASFVVVMLVRARHDPAINQGNPAEWSTLLEVVGRRQYDVPPLWPRRAPAWLQVGNLVQYTDWQVARSLSDAPGPSPLRTPVTLAFVVLGICGSVWHRRRDRRGWRALALLLAACSLGVVAMLNLRAGPSFGWGVLADGALREARERDYFFAPAFFVWGLWAGCGVAALAARGRSPLARMALALAALPLALNWRAVDRRVEPDVRLAEQVGPALLASAPERAVLILAGDNDTYPVWFAQHVLGVRRDVVPVTVPLLGAGWYREELRRRHALLDARHAEGWAGVGGTLAAIAAGAARAGRPLAAAVSLTAPDRTPLGRHWRLQGMVFVLRDSLAPALSMDSARSARVAALIDALGGQSTTVTPRESAGRYISSILRCPAAAAGGGSQRPPGDAPDAATLLESVCNYR